MRDIKQKNTNFEIKIKITTTSNCLIGNQTQNFSIGGVDQSTLVDEKGRPMIPGSSFKGVFRHIIREHNHELTETNKFIKEILNNILVKYQALLNTEHESNEKIEKLIKKIEECIQKSKAEDIFGIEGINSMPRLFCTDFRVIGDNENASEMDPKYFLIETKNFLEENNNEIKSNPRTYKVIKPGVSFQGSIRFQNQSSLESKIDYDLIKKELEKQLKKFDKGFYGIGNSKSRGYGNISVDFLS